MMLKQSLVRHPIVHCSRMGGAGVKCCLRVQVGQPHAGAALLGTNFLSKSAAHAGSFKAARRHSQEKKLVTVLHWAPDKEFLQRSHPASCLPGSRITVNAPMGIAYHRDCLLLPCGGRQARGT
eukprot:2160643-Rhodomonas_salina.2